MPDVIIDRQRMPREYQHMMRGPRFAWWRPPVAIILTGMFMLCIAVAAYGLLVAAGVSQWVSAAASQDATTPAMFAMTNLSLAAFIPATMLAMRITYGADPGYLSSVCGSIRWRWLARCAAIGLPLYAAIVGLDLLVDGPEGPIPAQRGMLLLLVLGTTPLQAAGEEYLFRGLILQYVAAWFRSPRAGLVVATILSTALFVAAHGSGDPWIMLDLAIGAIASCILIWKTGGLEGAIVLHLSNNVVSMAATILFGGWGSGFIEATSKGKPTDALLTLFVVAVLVPLVLKSAARHGIRSVYQPPSDVSGERDAAGSQRMNGWLWTAVAVPAALVLMAVLSGLVLPQLRRPQLPTLHYADVARALGVSNDGCLRGYLVDALPVELHNFRTKRLIEDGARLQLGSRVVTGHAGTFQFPISAELMTADPEVHVVRPNGKTIDFTYQFVKATVNARGTCPAHTP